MKNFIISSDSTCDLYADYVRTHDIRIVPLHYTMEENGQLTEGIDSFTEFAQYVGFYDKLRAGGFSRTSMLNFDSHYSHFKKLAEEGAEQILHYSLSGGLSPTANVAKEAAAAVMEKYPGCKIIAIDSLAATIGQGALVREAVRLRGEGARFEDAAAKTADMPLHIQYAIIANDLYYLKRGGRVSTVAAAAGTLLNIKPVLSFTKEGKLTVVEKVRGMKKACAYALSKKALGVSPRNFHHGAGHRLARRPRLGVHDLAHEGEPARLRRRKPRGMPYAYAAGAKKRSKAKKFAKPRK